ncbi:OLC1v1029494C1 [Oldenlandia corymbosa var. corymbosa]|uniref:OLC1v1029494C1 n=1 Tax=Oldenlandia corymbosa var. corymbosa TaxID=529605 RepID=A0AAV1CH38_OLDCO|nr:OLC1v1029494C1 [Oldenlandia corymbosa var. corymbosa]
MYDFLLLFHSSESEITIRRQFRLSPEAEYAVAKSFRAHRTQNMPSPNYRFHQGNSQALIFAMKHPKLATNNAPSPRKITCCNEMGKHRSCSVIESRKNCRGGEKRTATTAEVRREKPEIYRLELVGVEKGGEGKR